jgi:hypothetical protein
MMASRKVHRHFFVFLWCRKRRQTKQVRRHLLHLSKKTRVKNKQIKRKVDVHLLATDALVFLEERFLQQHFNNVFCNIASTSATRLLQQHFNIASVAPSSATLLLLLSDGEVWGLKCLGSRVDFFNG